MLASLRSGSADRVHESFILIHHLKQLEAADAKNSEVMKTQKGLFFVSLYASLEFTLTSAVSEFLSALQECASEPRTYRTGLLPTLLDREFKAVASGSSSRRAWEHKRNLIQRLFSNSACSIENDIFPAESKNISANHFHTIWRQLEIPGDPLPFGVNPWAINEIKDHRNAIAHGRERAATIGARFTIAALEQRHRTVESICAYTVMAFEQHLENRSFLSAP